MGIKLKASSDFNLNLHCTLMHSDYFVLLLAKEEVMSLIGVISFKKKNYFGLLLVHVEPTVVYRRFYVASKTTFKCVSMFILPITDKQSK
jgi:hypothetical protein